MPRQTDVMNPTTISGTFPRLPSSLIDRDNILDTINIIFEGETKIIVFEGEEGAGKTTLLAQFASKHVDNTLSLFVQSDGTLAYDADALRFDLCNQLAWITSAREISPEIVVDDAYWWNQIMELKRRARFQKYYFVIDGLDEIPEKYAHIREIILDLFSFEQKGFYFIFSGDHRHLFANRKIKSPYKTQILSGFSLDEAKRFLSTFTSDETCIEDFSKICRFLPGYLAIVKRKLSSGIDCCSLREEMPSQLSELFELEWPQESNNNEFLEKILAVLSFDRNKHSINDLGRILRLDTKVVQQLLQSLSFININETNEVTFTSEAFRKFTAKRLATLEEIVNNLLIDDYYTAPNELQSLINLPDYLENAKQFDRLLDYLSLDRFTKMIERHQSLGAVKQKADLGIRVSQELHRDGDLMRFSVQKSAIIELNGVEILRSEIEALVALNDYDAAIALAQNTVLKEDRMHLLAVIAKAKRKQKQLSETIVIDQIRQLYDEIDRVALGERAIEIAIDLIHSCPDLAVKLVEETAKADGNEKALDWALARLSIETIGTSAEETRTSDTPENIRARIKDPTARRLSNTFSLLFEKYSAEEVIATAENLSLSESLFLLRLWLIENARHKDAVEVVEYALKLAIKTTSDPDTRLFRDLAAPLPFIDNIEKLETLVAYFDGQMATLERIGPREDYIRLGLLLAETVSKYSLDKAYDRVEDIYLRVSYVEELTLKAESIARLVYTLYRIDAKKNLQRPEDLHDIVERELADDIDKLLKTTASHYEATRNIIKILSTVRRDLAFALAKKLNTKHRRQLALLDLLKSLCQTSTKKLDLTFIEELIKNFEHKEPRDEAVINVMRRLSKITNCQDTLIAQSLPLINRIADIEDAGDRCLSCCSALSFLRRQDVNKYASFIDKLLRQLDSAWQSIDASWHKVNVGFKVTTELSESSPEDAKKYLKQTEEFRNGVFLDSSTHALIYFSCLQLGLKAYKGLIISHFDTEKIKDLEVLTLAIEKIDSYGTRAGLWQELALYYYSAHLYDDCKSIVREHIIPDLENIDGGDRKFRNDIIVTVAPALYCNHKETAQERLLQLPQPQRDAAFENICEFIFRKRPLSDPYQTDEKQSYPIRFDEVVDICILMDLIESDSIICDLIEMIVNSLVDHKNENFFPSKNKTDIVNRLDKIVDSKLSKSRYIDHDGFKISALAQIARVRPTSSQTWKDLRQAARSIPNLSDSALVLSILADAMPSKEDQMRKECLHEAMEIVKQIAVIRERVQRYKYIAEKAFTIDPLISKGCLKLSMQNTVNMSSSNVHEFQQRIVEKAYTMYYKHDQNFVDSLISSVEDNASRVQLDKQLNFLKSRNKMIDSSKSKENIAELSLIKTPQTAWTYLSWLNAGYLNKLLPIETSRTLIRDASNLPLHEAYPILAWVIENIVIENSKTSKQARIYIQPIYEALLLGAELAGMLAVRSLEQLKRTRSYAAIAKSDRGILVRPNPYGSNVEREKALQYLKEWFAQNVQDYLIICDQFFGVDDLDILFTLSSVKPDCKVWILTSKKQQDKLLEPLETTYHTHWHIHISPIQAPPDTDIVIIGNKEGKSPIHDRWWLTQGSGLYFGTSFNGLGKSLSNMIPLDDSAVQEKEYEIRQYLMGFKREFQGEKLSKYVIKL